MNLVQTFKIFVFFIINFELQVVFSKVISILIVDKPFYYYIIDLDYYHSSSKIKNKSDTFLLSKMRGNYD